MIRPGILFGIARAESRLTRRLVRYWVFQSLALLVGLIAFLYYGLVLHRNFSSWSATAAMINPRYLIGAIGLYYLSLFLFGLIFLGFDVRARDRRERMAEVMDALPCSNLELVLGRFVGILIPSWIPVVIVSCLLLVLGLAINEPIEPYSLLTFTLAMAIPAYSFVLGLTFLMTLLLRHRLLAAVVLCLALIGLIMANVRFVPVYLLPLADFTGGFSVANPSDIVPSIVDWRGLIQRSGFLIAGIGLAWLAAAFYPRKDDGSRVSRAAVGTGLVVIGLTLNGFLVVETLNLLETKQGWIEAHRTRSEEPSPNLLAMGGEIRIDPGRSLTMDLDLRFAAPRDVGLESALFSLNPGIEVREVTGASGASLGFTHESGLFEVQLTEPLGPGEETTIGVTAEGDPHHFFSYLDSAFDPFSVSIQEGSVFMLGWDPIVFDRRSVVLVPGARWLPASGAEIGRADPRVRPADFFAVDVVVEVPEDWLVAGPGRRQDAGAGEGGNARYRFAPPGPVPDVALVGGRFESRATEIGDVRVEVLIHPAHVGNVEFFEDAGSEIHRWLEEKLTEADEVGLGYPYDALTLVEVPGILRGFAGGWRMDTTLSHPGMILMRESSFPTARFDVPFKDPAPFRDREGGLPRAKLERLEAFFENDFSGGNPFQAAARSFFNYQTAGAGPAGLPLDYVFEDLSTRLITDKVGYFSVHHYGSDLGETANQTIMAVFQNQGQDIAESIVRAIVSRTDVWDAVLGVSLEELDPWDDPKRTVDVLTLKGGAMARSMLDGMGREKTGELLAQLRLTRTGETYTGQDVVDAGEVVGEDLGEWLAVWLGETELPGFTLGEVRFERITDADDGSPQYQVAVRVRNEEETPGLIKLEYRAGQRGEGFDSGQSDPVSVPGGSAVEIGMVVSRPPRMVRVVPYLALNRDPFNVPMPAVDEERIVEIEPFVGTREIAWTPPEAEWVVVDDLDDGFRVEESEERSMWRFGRRGADDEVLDGGLPVMAGPGGPRSRWMRNVNANAFGKYRHTMAMIRPGEGKNRAIFGADLPNAGSWELEYYLPQRRGIGRRRAGRSRGTWNLVVADDSGRQDVTFDAEGGETGWNALGTFEVAGGEVLVEVTDQTEGSYVVADAIRWRPASGAATVGEDSP